MIISNKNGNTIYKSWRDNGVKISEEVEFRPYFYVLADEKEIPTYSLNKYTKVNLNTKKGIGKT